MKITLDLASLINTRPYASSHQGAYHLLLHNIVPPFLKLLLEHTEGNKSAAARIAGLNRSTLDRKIQYYQMHLETKVYLPSPTQDNL